MEYLCRTCLPNRTNIVYPQNIYNFASKKFILSVFEIDKILKFLSDANYIIFVAYTNEKGYYYCVKLKNKGQRFLTDKKNYKKSIFAKAFQTLAFASAIFIIALLLKTIFGG